MSWYSSTSDEKTFQEQITTHISSRQRSKIVSKKVFRSPSKLHYHSLPQKPKSNRTFYKKFQTNKSNSSSDTKPSSNHNLKSNSNSNSRTNSSLWIRIDLSTITFYPDGNKLSSICGQMELLLKYSRSVLAISFNKKKFIEEIQIPWSGIKSFRIVDKRGIEIVFCEGFQAKYCNHIKNSGKYMITEEIIKDPTGGFMNGTTSILLNPCSRVHPVTIMMIDVAIQRFCFCDGTNNDRKEKDVDVDLNNATESKEEGKLSNALSRVSGDYDNIMYITIVFLTHHRIMLSPMNISVSAILQNIGNRFEIKIDSFKYKNINGDLITVMNEDDWKVAIWNTKKLGNRMTIHLSN